MEMLKQGSKGKEVVRLQRLLGIHDNAREWVDEIFGKEVEP